MRTPMTFSVPSSLRSTLVVLATLGAASSLLACTGDDTNPPVVEAPTDAAADATSSGDGGQKDSATGTDATGTDSAPGTDSATGTDSSATDSAAQQG
jgi:hypothetical protein